VKQTRLLIAAVPISVAL